MDFIYTYTCIPVQHRQEAKKLLLWVSKLQVWNDHLISPFFGSKMIKKYIISKTSTKCSMYKQRKNAVRTSLFSFALWRILSSIEPLVTSLYTVTCRVWPRRWARSMACKEKKFKIDWNLNLICITCIYCRGCGLESVFLLLQHNFKMLLNIEKDPYCCSQPRPTLNRELLWVPDDCWTVGS